MAASSLSPYFRPFGQQTHTKKENEPPPPPPSLFTFKSRGSLRFPLSSGMFWNDDKNEYMQFQLGSINLTSDYAISESLRGDNCMLLAHRP